MNITRIIISALLTACPLLGMAQSTPSIAPSFTYTDSKGNEQTVTSADDQAPLAASFHANATDTEGWNAHYEWHFYLEGQRSNPYLVRYETDTQSISIAESKLEMPNAFSPNGDGINDTYQAKSGYKSIVEFHATIFNRWGQKLYSWDDPTGGWDGKFHGKDVAQGVYYVLVKAKGADGRNYHIKRDVNLLRGYSETTSNNNE